MKKAGICVLILATTAIILNAQEIGIAARVNGVDITVFRLERFFDEYSRPGRRSSTDNQPHSVQEDEATGSRSAD